MNADTGRFDIFNGMRPGFAYSTVSQPLRLKPDRYAFASSDWDQMIDEDVLLKNTLAMKPEDIYHSDPGILGGTPVFTGTRVPVDSLVAHLKAGDPLSEFLVGFPTVRREQAEAFLELALKEALEVTPHEEPA